MASRLQREPVTIPRWVLTLKYGLFVTLGLVIIRAGSPSIEQATSADYLIVYGAIMAGFAAAALAGCLFLEWVEMVGALLLWSWLLVYVGATADRAISGNAGTQAISVVLLIVSLLPLARGGSILVRRIRTRRRLTDVR